MLRVDGVWNLRDIGGWAGDSGRTVARGLVYCSGSLDPLTSAGAQELNKLGLRTIVDLHQQLDPFDAGLLPGVHRISVPMGWAPRPGESAWSVFERPGLNPEEALKQYAAAKTSGYLHLISDQAARFAAVLTALAQPGALSALIHCASGKDRTGLVISVLLNVLGVDHTDIVSEYMLSRHGITPHRLDRYRKTLHRIGIEQEAFAPSTPRTCLPWRRLCR